MDVVREVVNNYCVFFLFIIGIEVLKLWGDLLVWDFVGKKVLWNYFVIIVV